MTPEERDRQSETVRQAVAATINAIIHREVPLQEIEKLVLYLYASEKKHYEEDGEPEVHVYPTVCAVKEWLKAIEFEPVTWTWMEPLKPDDGDAS